MTFYMVRNLFLITTFALVPFLNITFGAGNDTLRKEIPSVEIHAAYSMESNSSNKFLGLGLLSKYDVTTSGVISAILDLDFMYGIGPTKKINDVNFLVGLRSSRNLGQFCIFYEVSTGIGFVDNHDGTNGYAGNFSRLRVGVHYEHVGLELSIGQFVSGEFVMSSVGGIGFTVYN